MGREFVFVAIRQNWGEDRVFFLDEDGTQRSLPTGVLTVVLPIVSGIAAYGWSAWIGSMTDTPCDESRAGVLAGVTLIVIYLAPAIVVAHAAICDRKSRFAIGLDRAREQSECPKVWVCMMLAGLERLASGRARQTINRPLVGKG